MPKFWVFKNVFYISSTALFSQNFPKNFKLDWKKNHLCKKNTQRESKQAVVLGFFKYRIRKGKKKKLLAEH